MTATSGAWWGRFWTSLRISFWPFPLSKPWRALCFVFNNKAVPFPCGMYSLKYHAPGARGHKIGSLCSQELNFLCFHFSSQKTQTKPALPVSGFGMWKITQQGLSSKTGQKGPLKAAPWLSCMGGGLFERNLVLWKEEDTSRKAVRREQLCLWHQIALLCLCPYPFSLHPDQSLGTESFQQLRCWSSAIGDYQFGVSLEKSHQDCEKSFEELDLFTLGKDGSGKDIINVWGLGFKSRFYHQQAVCCCASRSPTFSGLHIPQL